MISDILNCNKFRFFCFSIICFVLLIGCFYIDDGLKYDAQDIQMTNIDDGSKHESQSIQMRNNVISLSATHILVITPDGRLWACA